MQRLRWVSGEEQSDLVFPTSRSDAVPARGNKSVETMDGRPPIPRYERVPDGGGHIRFRTSRSPAHSNGPVGSGQRFDQPRIASPLVTVTDVHHPGKAEGKGPSRVPRRDRDLTPVLHSMNALTFQRCHRAFPSPFSNCLSTQVSDAGRYGIQRGESPSVLSRQSESRRLGGS